MSKNLLLLTGFCAYSCFLFQEVYGEVSELTVDLRLC